MNTRRPQSISSQTHNDIKEELVSNEGLDRNTNVNTNNLQDEVTSSDDEKNENEENDDDDDDETIKLSLSESEASTISGLSLLFQHDFFEKLLMKSAF
jgi:hypothetical protein